MARNYSKDSLAIERARHVVEGFDGAAFASASLLSQQSGWRHRAIDLGASFGNLLAGVVNQIANVARRRGDRKLGICAGSVNVSIAPINGSTSTSLASLN